MRVLEHPCCLTTEFTDSSVNQAVAGADGEKEQQHMHGLRMHSNCMHVHSGLLRCLCALQ